MIKLTLTGKIAAGLALVLLGIGVYMLFFRPAPGPVVDDQGLALSVASKPPPGFTFPLDDKQAAAWDKKSAKDPAYCDFLSRYEKNRQTLLTFTALLDEDPKASPYFYTDPTTKREYYPVYPIGGARGADKALQASGQGAGEGDIDPCLVDSSESAGLPILVAFPPGAPAPKSKVIKVRGYMAYTSDYLGIDETLDTTVIVNAGSVSEASLQQALAPARSSRELDIRIRRGDLLLRLGRIEFASDQTRVWVQIFNSSSVEQPAWAGVSGSQITQEGAAEMPSGFELAAATDLQSAQGGAASDILPDAPVKPATAKAASLEGFITFGPVDPSKKLTLNIPDPSPGDSSSTPVILISLDPALNLPVKSGL